MGIGEKAGFVALVCALLAFPSAAGAATVTPTAGFFADDFTNNTNCSLREAIEVANDDASGDPEDSCGIDGTLGLDTVQLAAGTYELDITGIELTNSNSANDLGTHDADGLTIDGAGAGATAIDTDDGPAWTDRVLETSATTTVSDLTITDGNSGAFGGGGILATGGALTLDRVRVTLNATSGAGGGVKANNTSTSLTVNDSEISENTSHTGALAGGVSADAPTNTIDDSVIRDNTATGTPGRGGGISAQGALTLTDTLVADNHAVDTGVSSTPVGGGLRANATVIVKRSTFSGNEVAGGVTTTAGTARAGAGIQAASSNLFLVNSTVSGNTATGAGGHSAGLRVDGAATTAFVVSSTFADNVIAATEAGSALGSGTGNIVVSGSIIETSGGLPACSEVGGGNISSQDDNVFTDLSCGPEPGPSGNDDADADPMLGALADEGGPQVGPPGFLATLPTRSPALASTAIEHVPAGDCNDSPSGTLVNDERGFARPFDTDANATADCEAGATEVFPCLGEAANRVGTAGGETLTGTSGDDVIVALGGDDEIEALGGNDRLCGGDGDDDLRGGAGDDQLDGGANTAGPVSGDFANFGDSASAVSANLSTDGATGDGTDSFTPGTIENLLGSPQGDSLTGDAGPNLIGGAAGNDAINGLGGDDGLDGQVGASDEVLHTGAPGPVTVTLQDPPTLPLGSATGFGTDVLFGFEEVSATGFGDTLTGNSGPNVLRGLAGDDILTGLGDADALFLGADDDTVNAQDGITDTIDCTGGGTDTGTLDTSPAETYVACDADGDSVVDFFDSCPTQAGSLANGCPAPVVAPPPTDTTDNTAACAALKKKLKKAKSKKAKKKFRKKLKALGC